MEGEISQTTASETPYKRPKFLSPRWFFQWFDIRAYAKALKFHEYNSRDVAIYNLSTVNTLFGAAILTNIKEIFAFVVGMSLWKSLATKASALGSALWAIISP